jgi:NAD(P)-dependent dehydrogenase (short-subunit alcohol dehydrogenase family)
MKLSDKVIVVTGGASGIGRAMVERFAREKPRALVVADLDGVRAESVAREVGGAALACDVSREAEVQSLIARVKEKHGPIDLFCANAGIAGSGGGIDVPDADWDKIWRVNFMSHVWTARALLPDWLERKSGYLLHTASAAGLLTMVGGLPYSVSKHAVVSLAEWLSITYGERGIKVSCLCPLFVNTPLVGAFTEMGGESVAAAGNMIEPTQVAEAVVAGLEAEKFLILSHPEVATYFQRKAGDYDRWLNGMRRFQKLLIS